MENYVLGDGVEMQPISNENGRKTLRSRKDRDRSIPVLLSDPDMLDCCICYEPLSIPVFQVCAFSPLAIKNVS
ncbi:hypothetical protein SESBI_05595 [Sesbania bispinosa]|nr:hypothetical protein SESBI_05595 [Sesbania bispinosa]